MKNQKYKEEIISLMDEYESLNSQDKFEQAGKIYLKLTRRVLKKIARDPLLFQSIIDDLLYFTDKPTVQIEIATEAIGMNYRKEDAIRVIESYAIWQPDMTYTNEKGRLCNTAQMRLHNLLGYVIDDNNHSWERPDELEITAIYKQFFEERNNNRKISM